MSPYPFRNGSAPSKVKRCRPQKLYNTVFFWLVRSKQTRRRSGLPHPSNTGIRQPSIRSLLSELGEKHYFLKVGFDALTTHTGYYTLCQHWFQVLGRQRWASSARPDAPKGKECTAFVVRGEGVDLVWLTRTRQTRQPTQKLILENQFHLTGQPSLLRTGRNSVNLSPIICSRQEDDLALYLELLSEDAGDVDHLDDQTNTMLARPSTIVQRRQEISSRSRECCT